MTTYTLQDTAPGEPMVISGNGDPNGYINAPLGTRYVDIETGTQYIKQFRHNHSPEYDLTKGWSNWLPRV